MDLSTHRSLYYGKSTHFDDIMNNAMTSRYYPRPTPGGLAQPAPNFAHFPRSRSFDSLAPGSVLARSHSACFPLPTVTYLPSYYYTPNEIDWYPKVGIHHQRFVDRYPFIKHRAVPFGTTQYAYSPLMSILDSTANSREHYTQRDRTSAGYLENALTIYQTKLRTSPNYGSGVQRQRGGGRSQTGGEEKEGGFNDVENAVKHFNERYYSTPALMGITDNRSHHTSKYWQSEREKGHRVGTALGHGAFDRAYASRY